jgi:hypothetical protein
MPHQAHNSPDGTLRGRCLIEPKKLLSNGSYSYTGKMFLVINKQLLLP